MAPEGAQDGAEAPKGGDTPSAVPEAAQGASTAQLVLPKPSQSSKPPGKTRPPGHAGEIAAVVAEAQAKLAEAGNTGAMGRDPYRVALAGLSVTIGVFPTIVRRIEDALSSTVVELWKLVQAVRHPLSEDERAILRREVVQAVDQAARERLGDAAEGLQRAMNLRSLALIGAALAVSWATVGVGAFFGGRASAKLEAEMWVAAQRADIAFSDGRVAALPLEDARAWLGLIRANPAIREALSKAQNLHTNPGGQISGAVPMWIPNR